MTHYQGDKTHVDIDRMSGKLRVFDAETGELMYDLKLKMDTPKARPKEEK